MSAPGRTVRLADRSYELDDFVRDLSRTTGGHAPRGVLPGVGSDTEGRVMEQVVDLGLLRSRPVQAVPSFDHLSVPEAEIEGTISEETLERLRALGYIQ
jgi:hypothetical protein